MFSPLPRLKAPPPYTEMPDISPSTSNSSNATVTPTRTCTRTRSHQESQPLPTYVRNRDNDEEYMSALRAWAEAKKYVTPGEDGTFADLSMAGGVKSVAWSGPMAVTYDRIKEGNQNKLDGKGKEKRPGRLRRLSRVLMRKESGKETS
jgi:hypothetical protein